MPAPPCEPSSASTRPRKGAFLELFAGTARLTRAFMQQHRATLRPLDCLFGSHHDLRRRATQLAVLSFIRAGGIGYVHLSTPCRVFSQSRKFILNAQRATDREREGVELGLFTAEIIEACNRCRVLWSLENPRGSRLFELPFLRPLLTQERVHRVDLDLCMYDHVSLKSVTVFTNLGPLTGLAAACAHAKHLPKRRVPSESDGEAMAGAFPLSLAAHWAQLASPLVEAKTRDSDILRDQLEYELGAVCQKSQAGSKQVHPRPGHHLEHQQLGLSDDSPAIFNLGHSAHRKDKVPRRRRQPRASPEHPCQPEL